MILSTYINDRSLSNYPFVDGVELPFPRSIFRMLQVEQPRDVRTGKILQSDAVRLKSISINNDLVSIALSNGVHGEAQGSMAYGSLYDSSYRLCGRFQLGVVPTDLSIQVETDIELRPDCIAKLCGTDTCKDGLTVTVNELPYTISDILEIEFTGDVSLEKNESSTHGVDARYTVNCETMTIDEDAVGAPIEVPLVAGINANKEELLIGDHYNEDCNTMLVLHVAYPMTAKCETTHDGTLHVKLNGVSPCKECLEDPPSEIEVP